MGFIPNCLHSHVGPTFRSISVTFQPSTCPLGACYVPGTVLGPTEQEKIEARPCWLPLDGSHSPGAICSVCTYCVQALLFALTVQCGYRMPQALLSRTSPSMSRQTGSRSNRRWRQTDSAPKTRNMVMGESQQVEKHKNLAQGRVAERPQRLLCWQ